MSHHSRLLVQPSHSLGSVFLGALFITLLLASRGINQGVCPVPIFRVRSFALPNLRGFLLDRINKTHNLILPFQAHSLEEIYREKSHRRG